MTPTAIRSQTRRSPIEVGRLARRAANREREAWEQLIDEFGDLVWSITRAHRLDDEDAADVWQTTWMRLVDNLDRLSEPRRLGAWLSTTARRECLASMRRPVRVIPAGDLLLEIVDDAPEHDSALLERERDDVLWSAFGRLSERDRTLLRLVVTPPATPCYEEVGGVLGMPVGSIGPTRRRALERLRREIHDRDLVCLEAA